MDNGNPRSKCSMCRQVNTCNLHPITSDMKELLLEMCDPKLFDNDWQVCLECFRLLQQKVSMMRISNDVVQAHESNSAENVDEGIEIDYVEFLINQLEQSLYESPASPPSPDKFSSSILDENTESNDGFCSSKHVINVARQKEPTLAELQLELKRITKTRDSGDFDSNFSVPDISNMSLLSDDEADEEPEVTHYNDPIKLKRQKPEWIKASYMGGSYHCCSGTQHFDRLMDLLRHEIQIHWRDYFSIDYVCIHCTTSFTGHGSLRRHMNRFHRGQILENDCDICGESFTAPRFVDKHKMKAHQEVLC